MPNHSLMLALRALPLPSPSPPSPTVPEDYIEYFREHNVGAVVRLNKKMYESSRFTQVGAGGDACAPVAAWEAAGVGSGEAHQSASWRPSSTCCTAAHPSLPSSTHPQYGVRHYEMYFPDGTCPSEQILLRFLEVAEREPGALAVRPGLGWAEQGCRVQQPLVT